MITYRLYCGNEKAKSIRFYDDKSWAVGSTDVKFITALASVSSVSFEVI
jgi:hypothetical protein